MNEEVKEENRTKTKIRESEIPGYEEIVTMKPEEIKEEFERLGDRVEELSRESRDFQDKFKRTQADFANYRRRMQEEKSGLAVEYKCELIEELLPVIDNFERALDSCEINNDFSQGVEMIYKQLINVLEKEGVEEIEAEGEEFDPRRHEAVEEVEVSEEDSGTVVEVVQTGYRFEDKIIRPAMVKVAN